MVIYILCVIIVLCIAAIVYYNRRLKRERALQDKSCVLYTSMLNMHHFAFQKLEQREDRWLYALLQYCRYANDAMWPIPGLAKYLVDLPCADHLGDDNAVRRHALRYEFILNDPIAVRTVASEIGRTSTTSIVEDILTARSTWLHGLDSPSGWNLFLENVDSLIYRLALAHNYAVPIAKSEDSRSGRLILRTALECETETEGGINMAWVNIAADTHYAPLAMHGTVQLFPRMGSPAYGARALTRGHGVINIPVHDSWHCSYLHDRLTHLCTDAQHTLQNLLWRVLGGRLSTVSVINPTGRQSTTLLDIDETGIPVNIHDVAVSSTDDGIVILFQYHR